MVTNGELNMSGDDSCLLVGASAVSGLLENLSDEALEDGSQEDRGAGTDSFHVVSLSEESLNATDGKKKSGPVGSGLCLRLRLSSLSAPRHDDCRRFGVS